MVFATTELEFEIARVGLKFPREHVRYATEEAQEGSPKLRPYPWQITIGRSPLVDHPW